MHKSLKIRLLLVFLGILVSLGSSIPYLTQRIIDATRQALEYEAARENIRLLDRAVINQKESVVSWFRPIFQGSTLTPLTKSPPDIKDWENRLIGPVNATATMFGVNRVVTFDSTGQLISNYSIPLSPKNTEPEKLLKTEIAQALKEDRILSTFKKSDTGLTQAVIVFPLSNDDSPLAVIGIFIDINLILQEFSHSIGYESRLSIGALNLVSDKPVETGQSFHFYEKRQVLLPASLFGEAGTLDINVDVTDLNHNISKIKRGLAVTLGLALLVIVPCLALYLIYLVAPLSQLVNFAQTFAKGDFSIRVSERGSTEISILAKSFNKMAVSIEERNKTILAKGEQLESALGTLRSIFHGVEQGIAIVDSQLRIVGEYSSHLEKLLECSNLNNLSLKDLMFAHAPQSADTRAQFDACLDMLFGTDSITYEANSHLLPRYLEFNLNNSTKYIALEWFPLEDSEGIVNQLIVTARDMTLIKKLNETLAQNEREIALISQIVKIPVQRFEAFIDASRISMQKIKKDGASDDLSATFPEIKRTLHTVKGNSRVLGFSFLSEFIHDLETMILELEKIPSKTPKIESFEENGRFMLHLEDAIGILEEYTYIHQFKLRRVAHLREESLARLRRFVEKSKILLEQDSDISQATMRSLLLDATTLEHYRLPDLAEEFRGNLANTDRSYSSAMPILEVEDRLGWIFDSSLVEALKGCLAHLVSNSLIHGAVEGQASKLEFCTRFCLTIA